MRWFCLTGCAGLAFALAVPALAVPDFPTGAESLERQQLAKLAPEVKTWIKEQARATVSAGHISEGRARVLAQGAHLTTGEDVSTLSFLLLMQSVRDADADLDAVMSSSQQTYAEQDELGNITRARGPAAPQLSPGAQAALSDRPGTKNVITLRSGEPVGGPELGAPKADVDLSVHLDLQTAMERESQAEDALAQAMKHLSPTTK
jgi:hypothetical protein